MGPSCLAGEWPNINKANGASFLSFFPFSLQVIEGEGRKMRSFGGGEGNGYFYFMRGALAAELLVLFPFSAVAYVDQNAKRARDFLLSSSSGHEASFADIAGAC